LLAAELGPHRDAKAVNAELLRCGVVANAVTATSLRFAPPVTVTESEIDEMADILTAVLAEDVGRT
jgi:acetylornithine/succinyldiaminopimelate/putrescine aminotransferase